MAIYEIRLEDRERWDATVRSFKEYDVYWLSGYVKAFQLHGDGEPLLFYYEDGALRGVNVVMRRDIADCAQFAGKLPANTYFDLATPYGYGGWLIENPDNEDTAPLFRAYEEHCRGHRIVSEFVRFHPVVKNHIYASPYYEVVELGDVVAIDLSSPEEIWANFASTCRNRVRKATNNGVRIYNGRYPEIYETFRNIYNQTMDKDHAVSYYYFSPAFYESVLNDLPEHAQIFYAQIPDGTVIAASIMLTANGMMNYHLGGSLREYSQLAPMNQMFYKAALWGCANGCSSLYLGGGVGSSDDTLLRFKKTFYKGNTSRFYIGKRVFDAALYQKLMEMRGGDELRKDFFPLYRA